MSDEKKDWRIGLSCKPKLHDHPLHYEQGEILDVLPCGTGGYFDKSGVLKIKMQSGTVMLAPASEWVTA